MKKIILVQLFLLLFIIVESQTITPLDTTVWSTNYKLSAKQSVDLQKPLIMVFSGSDWCKPCIKLREQILVDTVFINWAKNNAVCLSLDFPNQKKNELSIELNAQNDSLAEIYNLNGIFPLVLIFSFEGKVLGSLGYENIPTNEYIIKIENIINKH